MHYAYKQGATEERRMALEQWAEAVRQKARPNFVKNATKQMPQGFPGFRKAIEEALELLAFVPEDRAPHGFVMTCK